MRFIALHSFFLTAFLGSLCLPAPVAIATEKWSPLIVDRIALALTGLPATTQDKTDLASGKMTLDDFLEKQKKHPRFEMKIAEFWNEILGIDRPVDFTKMVSKRKTDANPEAKHYFTLDKIIGRTKAITGSQINNGMVKCGKPSSWIYAYAPLKNTDKDDIQVIDGKTYTNSLYHCGCRHKDQQGANCKPEECNVSEVKPYWNMNTTVRACSLLTHENFCGPNLRNCWFKDDGRILTYFTRNQLYQHISYGFTMEPGMIIAKIIAGDRSWNDVVKTSNGTVNEPLAYMLKDERVGKDYIENFLPEGAQHYPDRQTNPIYKDADPSRYQKFHMVETGGLQAGILKTMAYHRTANGWRAKANLLRESLLCTSFIPPNEAQVESDEEDLTKRPYCSHCHKTLEPLSQFFERWPDNDNFFHDNSKAAQGKYEGLSGVGVEALANIVTRLDEYQECAVKRAFEYIVRRPMSEKEENNILKPLVNEFSNQDKRLWPVMKKIILSPEFIGTGRN